MSNVGDMLRLARQRLGFTQKEAAFRLGLLQPVLSRFENGLANPDSAELSKAALVYELPLDFFELRDPVYGPPVSVHAMLRGASDVTGREVDAITAELNLRVMHLGKFLQSVDYNVQADVPALDVERFGSPAKIAATVRAHWNIPSGPIRNLTEWVERAGIVVGLSDFGGAVVSGVTFRVPGRLPIILLNRNHPSDRMRYTLAHEIGHLILHRFPTEEMEKEANDFASALLMPEQEMAAAFFGRRVTLKLLAALKLEWKVSMQALLMRASSLGFVTSNQSRYLWQQISSKGWRTKEPPELDFEPEQPTVLSSIIQTHIDDLGYSVEELCRVLRIREVEFFKMYGVVPSVGPKEKAGLRLVK